MNKFKQASVRRYERQSKLHSFQFPQVERVALATDHQPHGIGVRVHGVRTHGLHNTHGHGPRSFRPHGNHLPVGSRQRHGRRPRQLRFAEQSLRRPELRRHAAATSAAPDSANGDSPAVRPFEFARPESAAHSVQQSSVSRSAFGPAANFWRWRWPENRLDLIKMMKLVPNNFFLKQVKCDCVR